MKKLLLAISVALFTTFAVNAQDTQTPPKPKENPNAPEIKFEKTNHDYGTIKKAPASDDPSGNCEFKYTNTGKEPLILQSVTASCGCTVPSWDKAPIMPGKTGVIKVHYATNRVGAINKSITVKSNAKNSPAMLTISGNVQDVSNETTPVKKESGPVNH